MTRPPPLPDPDAASWTLAAGLSFALHMGLVTALVLALSGAPGAAPGPGPEIVLRSVPLIAGGGQEAAPRLAASPAQTRLAPQDDPDRAESAAQPDTAERVTPERLPAEDQSPERQTPETRALETAPAARTLPPEALRPVSPTPEAPRREALRVTANPPPTTPRPDARLQPVPPTPAVSAPQRLRAAPPAPPAAHPSATQPPATRLRPAPQEAPAAQRMEAARPLSNAPAATGPTSAERPQSSPDSLRRAMLPPTEDTLERALRDRPRTFLSDRRAAARPSNPGGGLPAPAPEDPTAPDQPLYAEVLDHLRALPDIPCFAALPALDEAGQLRLEVFGPAQTGLEAFRAGLEEDTGLVPGMVLRAVTQGQCETLDFIRRNRAYPAFSLYLSLSERQIASGAQVQGAVHMAGGRALALLLVDNAGRVQSLERFLRGSADGRAGFTVPMTLQGPAVETWQLLMAIATDSPLAVTQTLSGAQEAAPFFARLRAEIATRGHSPDLALIAFSLK